MRMIAAPAPQPPSPLARVLLVLVMACTGLLTPLSADAQWKWRDKDGRITVSDRPPPREVPEKDILSRPSVPARAPAVATPAPSPAPGTAVAAASAPMTALEREVQARRRAAEEEKATKAKADEERNAARRAENCRQARNQLAALESGQRIARTNDKGEREVLDDAGRAQETQRTREVIASDCR
jgi:type IV secretory pathway VirB10-like protein